jgi:hypothetical protein
MISTTNHCENSTSEQAALGFARATIARMAPALESAVLVGARDLIAEFWGYTAQFLRMNHVPEHEIELLAVEFSNRLTTALIAADIGRMSVEQASIAWSPIRGSLARALGLLERESVSTRGRPNAGAR